MWYNMYCRSVYNITIKRQRKEKNASNYQNELEQFIYEVCYHPMWEEAAQYISAHPYALDLSRSRIKYPTSAYLENLSLEFTCNIRIAEDILSFDAVTNCSIALIEETEWNCGNSDIIQWLTISCEAKITDRLECLKITNICPYQRGYRKTAKGTFSSNIIPYIKKEDLEQEAEVFLKQYCPEALERPMCVPISAIAESMGLTIIQGRCLTDDFSIFGEICFSAGNVELFDLFKCSKSTVEVSRGTILIDAYTFWERNLGCVNNTIAHEVFHWYKHRMYAAIKHILRKERFVACRCPSNAVYPEKDMPWTDEQRMEWQANSLAPRILMPLATFKVKVAELYAKYRIAGEKDAQNPLLMELVAEELATFYAVSKQSVLIRMQEVGFSEAKAVSQFESINKSHYDIEEVDAFFVYSTNAELRRLLNDGLFVYAQKHFVLNDPSYVFRTEDGKLELTQYALEHLDTCTLSFSWIEVPKIDHPHVPLVLMHRANASQRVSAFIPKENQATIAVSEELQRKRDEFEKQTNSYRLANPQKTAWQLMGEIITQRGMSSPHFCRLTGLDEVFYRRAINGANTRPSIETIVAFSCGLDLDIQTAQKIMQLASHAFDESDLHRAYMFCIGGLSGHSIEERNTFLESYGYPPLGTKQKK